MSRVVVYRFYCNYCTREFPNSTADRSPVLPDGWHETEGELHVCPDCFQGFTPEAETTWKPLAIASAEGKS